MSITIYILYLGEGEEEGKTLTQTCKVRRVRCLAAVAAMVFAMVLTSVHNYTKIHSIRSMSRVITCMTPLETQAANFRKNRLSNFIIFGQGCNQYIDIHPVLVPCCKPCSDKGE